MGPSLVLSSVSSMAANWNRNSLSSTFNISGSSNDDDDDEDVGQGHSQPSNSASIQGRPQGGGNDSFPSEQLPRSSHSFAVSLFHNQPEVDLELDRERAATYSYTTRALETTDSTAAISSAQRESTFAGLEFSMSPIYAAANVGQYLPPLVDIAESRTDRVEEALNVGDYDRKPAAAALPRKDASLQNPYTVPAQKEQASPHRKSHSISSDPFHLASDSSKIMPPLAVTTRERFIDPTFSFEDDYGARDFDETQLNISRVWETSEHNDPSSKFHRRRHFTPPHADFAAPSHRSAYASATPVAFRLGDRYPDSHNDPPLVAIHSVVDSVAATTTSRKSISNRPSLPIAMHQLPQPILPARNVVLHRREASTAELESAETDRARSAIHVWYKRFNELIDYSETYGDCNVPQKYTPNAQLGIWVNKQRMEKKFMDENKRTSMTATKVEALESIGFTWAKRKGDASWLYKYHELRKFLEQFGSCDVPTKYVPYPALGRWVSTQRSEYKIFMQTGGRSRHLTQEKIDMLNVIGFKWEMIPSRLSNSSSHSNSTAGGDGGRGGNSTSSHNTNTSSQGSLFRSREV